MKRLLIAIVSLSIIFLTTSCSTTVKEIDETEKEPTSFYYRLRGEGPDGTAFGWKEINSQYIVLTDLRIGQWTLYAEKLDPKGNKVATGEVTAFITDSSDSTEIPFTSGTGM